MSLWQSSLIATEVLNRFIRNTIIGPECGDLFSLRRVDQISRSDYATGPIRRSLKCRANFGPRAWQTGDTDPSSSNTIRDDKN